MRLDQSNDDDDILHKNWEGVLKVRLVIHTSHSCSHDSTVCTTHSIDDMNVYTLLTFDFLQLCTSLIQYVKCYSAISFVLFCWSNLLFVEIQFENLTFLLIHVTLYHLKILTRRVQRFRYWVKLLTSENVIVKFVFRSNKNLIFAWFFTVFFSFSTFNHTQWFDLEWGIKRMNNFFGSKNVRTSEDFHQFHSQNSNEMQHLEMVIFICHKISRKINTKILSFEWKLLKTEL